tara:strand:- start:854 stop:1570 length:717 start_codon:yes stop_codon:yes gene_type:complete
MSKKNDLCLVMPCYRSKKKVLNVIKKIDFNLVSHLIVIDDGCPQKTGLFIEKNFKSKKISIFISNKNQGVGAATIKGIKIALKKGYKFIGKIDSDGQHNPKDLKKFIYKIKKEKTEFCKAFRVLNFSRKKKMPYVRFFGNFFLTLIFRIVSGKFYVKDVTNGYLIFSARVIKSIDLNNLKKNYFFEQDLLTNVLSQNFKISQIEIDTVYNNENSNLKPLNTIIPFIIYYLRILRKNIF